MPIGTYQNLLAMGFRRLAVDATASAFNGSSGTSLAAAIITPGPDEIIVATGHYIGTSNTSGVISGGGLTWTQRFSQTDLGDLFRGIDVYWALASAAGSYTVTLTHGLSVGNRTLALFAVKGANLTTPFDPNVSLPASVVNNTNSAAVPTKNITTTHDNDMLIGWNRPENAGQSPGSGFSTIAVTADLTACSEFKIVTSAGAQTVNFANSVNQNTAYADAIQSA